MNKSGFSSSLLKTESSGLFSASKKRLQKIEAVVNTGKTAKSISLLSDSQVAKRKGELFKRISASRLQHLLTSETHLESVFRLPSDDGLSNLFSRTEKQAHSFYQNSTANVLLLDFRLIDEFERFHIKDALNFSYFHLNQDKYPPEILLFVF